MAKKKKAKRKPLPQRDLLSPDAILGAIVGNDALRRAEVNQKIWAYIVNNGLQDKQNKRMINADEKLKVLFGGRKQVSMFEMTQMVNKHVSLLGVGNHSATEPIKMSIKYPTRRSKFTPPCMQALKKSQEALQRGEVIQLIFEVAASGYSGDIVVDIDGANSDTFKTDWHNADPTRFPARIKGAAHALQQLKLTGLYRVGHSDSNMTIQYLESKTDEPKGTKKPDRVTSTNDRIIRNSAIGNRVKEIYDHTCQICGMRLETPRGPYAECCHIRPLGKPHNGPDTLGNVLCLCPTHHVLIDYHANHIADDFTIIETGEGLAVDPAHKLEIEHIRYHRDLHAE